MCGCGVDGGDREPNIGFFGVNGELKPSSVMVVVAAIGGATG